VNLEKCLSAYEYYSGKASDIARTLSLSGIAVIWVLRETTSSAPFLSPALYWPGIFFVGALAADLLHYVYGAIVWGVFHRRQELRGLARDVEFKAPRWVNWPTFTFFSLKLLLVGIGYALLLTHLIARFPTQPPVPAPAPKATVPSVPAPVPNPPSTLKVAPAGLAIDPVAVSVAEALGVWAAVVVALFWPPIQGWFMRPKLSIRATPERQSFHKTVARSNVDARISFACYYYRLDVVNDGRSAAREVEVFARAAFRLHENGGWEKDERFLPQWFCWATWRELQHERRVFMPVIPPRSTRYVDFAHVVDPAGRNAFELENDPAVPTASAILSLDVAIRYMRLGHLLGPGKYALVVEVSASNAEPEAFVVAVNNPGVWDLNESNMLSRGVKVETVQSLEEWKDYRAIKGLLGAGS
jgi:hypothetical protein